MKNNIKKNIKAFFYNLVIFLLKFNFFKKTSRHLLNAYLINKGYCFDWEYVSGKSKNNLFQGENIFLSKLDYLNIKNCIDVGANIGHFSKEVLKNKNTNVVAFEPLPACSEPLLIMQNEYRQRFIFFKYALSNKNDFEYINFGDSKSPLASLETMIDKIDYVKINNTNQIKVELKKLDNYINDDNFKNIDFIKIDTEGHESKVIEGGINFINKHRVKLIQIEFNWHHLFTHNTIFQFSEMLKNYVPVQMNLINGKLLVVDSNNYFSNIYHLSQFVFIEKDFFKENSEKLLS